jgi:hypothetical protein
MLRPSDGDDSLSRESYQLLRRFIVSKLILNGKRQEGLIRQRRKKNKRKKQRRRKKVL